MGRLWYGFLVICFVAQAGAAIAETTEERLERLEQAIGDMKKHEASEREVEGQPPATRPDETPNVQQLGAQGQGAERKYGSIMQGSGKLIYARPFVSNPKAIVGGYTDIEYLNRKNQGTPSTFDQHRFVPFIYADVSEHVKFAAELEIEHGIREGSASGTEVSLEFMTIDYLVNDKINLRGGVILLPIGKFNLLHDAPLRDLTDRPLVTQFLYGVVAAETGAGFYGTFYPTRRAKLDYELYVTTGYNGFGGGNPCGAGGMEANARNAGTCNNLFTEANGLKNGRQRKSAIDDGFDNNNGKAVVGRVAFSPFLGVEIGGSGYTGTYDPFGNRRLTIAAVDWTLVRGPFELIGEYISTYVQGNSKQIDGTPCIDSFGHLCPQRMSGYYVQGNYHFMPEWLTRVAPSFFRPEISTFTAVLRWEQIDTNRDFKNGLGDRERVTFGLNFRPTEDTVFKADFQYSPKEINVRDQRIHDTALILSAATYF